MRKLLLLLVMLAIGSPLFGQGVTVYGGKDILGGKMTLGSFGGLSLYPGWTVLQDIGFNSACSSTVCSFTNFMNQLTAGSIRLATVYCDSASNIALSSVSINSANLTLCGASCTAFN